ncbi:MAG: hypothetical protein Q8K30_05265 [Candidatus Gracilibacteria bacterium]|nr:hypothetical protein [Candidatus Gracilibacteria bacterium]
MTEKTRKIIEKGLEGSIEKQDKLFNQNFITKFLYGKAVKKGLSAKF